MIPQIRRFLATNATAILSGLAVTGVVTTSVLAVKATPSALEDVRDFEENTKGGLKATPWEMVKVSWRNYVPAAISAGTTIITIISAQRINNRRQVVLMSALAMGETAYSEYKDKVKEVLGAKKEEEVRNSISEDRVKKSPPTENAIHLTGNGGTLFFEPLSGRYFKSDVEKVRKAVNEINFELTHHDHASLNDFFSFVDLPRVDMGDELGWNIDRLLEIRIVAHMMDNDAKTPCLALEYSTSPKPFFTQIWRS